MVVRGQSLVPRRSTMYHKVSERFAYTYNICVRAVVCDQQSLPLPQDPQRRSQVSSERCQFTRQRANTEVRYNAWYVDFDRFSWII